MAFTEDLSEFIDTTDGFAVSATLAGSSVNGILTEDDETTNNVEGTRRVFVLDAAGAPDIPAGTAGLALIIGVTTYEVHKKTIEDGLAYLTIEKVSKS